MVRPVRANGVTRRPTVVAIRAALADVTDPEIPVISIVDLGIVDRVEVVEPEGVIQVTLLPTFVGCPALEMIRAAVTERLGLFGRPVRVDFAYSPPWTSDRISPRGRERLRRGGFAPPTAALATGGPILISLSAAPPVSCPHCGSRGTVAENAFGPTACRSIHYCTACRQPFEAIKAI